MNSPKSRNWKFTTIDNWNESARFPKFDTNLNTYKILDYNNNIREPFQFIDQQGKTNNFLQF